MKIWTSFTVVATLSMTAFGLEGCPPVRAEQVAAAHDMNMDPSSTASGPQAGPVTAGQAAFATLKQLIGKWEAPLRGNKTIVDTFQPFAFGNAILAEEWVGGEQVTSTVFYMVGSDLRADHYCDYGNQPRYVAGPSADPSTVELEFREATNLDTHPRHFHSTRWRLVDASHMTQDWDVEGGEKGKNNVHLDFVRQQ
jgi:hypothetical protein